MKQLPETIKMLRQKSLLTQADFAAELNVAVSTVNRWEKGKAVPHITAMKAIKEFCKEHEYPYEEIESCWLNQGKE